MPVLRATYSNLYSKATGLRDEIWRTKYNVAITLNMNTTWAQKIT